MQRIVDIDTELFWWINQHHNTVLDWSLWTISQHWGIAAVLLLCFCMVTLRCDRQRWWIVVLAVVLCFFLADQGSVQLFKETVHRLRPCHALEGVRMFHTRCGGQYGFVSSHAANVFAIILFFCMRYRRSRWVTGLLVVWGLLTCYSRVYLGKHYPGDVVCGAIFGALVGLAVYALVQMIEKKLPTFGTK